MKPIRPGERYYHRPTGRSVLIEALSETGRTARCYWASAYWTPSARVSRDEDGVFECPVDEVAPFSQVGDLRRL